MSSDPDALVAAFKASGQFDKLRKELLASAQNSEECDDFKRRIGEIVKKRLQGNAIDPRPETLHKDLLQEVARFPVVERFALSTPMLSENSFKDNLRESLTRILNEEREKSSSAAATQPPHPDSAAPPPPPA
ncbi:hypothetical protein MKEN_00057600 [Mycena kentingensis (nom. inval.)]|nr:hypothetical protein MKEN_00057600 [Mycena kentingensis (nom. inval.)]